MGSIVSVRQKCDFERIFRSGRGLEMGCFRARFLSTTLPYSRIGLMVSRSVSKSAVVRNRLRRRVREWLRTHPNVLARSMDIVLVFKKGSVTTSKKKLYEELVRAVQKIHS